MVGSVLVFSRIGSILRHLKLLYRMDPISWYGWDREGQKFPHPQPVVQKWNQIHLSRQWKSVRLRNSVKDQHGGSACFQTIFVSRLRLIRANSETAIPFYEEFLTEERVTPYLFVRDIHEKLLFGGKTSEMGITIDFDSLQDSTDITTRGYSPVLGSLHGNSDSEKFMDFLLSKKILLAIENSKLVWNIEKAESWTSNIYTATLLLFVLIHVCYG